MSAPDRAARVFGNTLRFAAKRCHQPLLRAHLHVMLRFELRERRLVDPMIPRQLGGLSCRWPNPSLYIRPCIG